MSHFSVLVVAKNKDDLRLKMLPYHEHECTGYDDFCVFVDDIHDEHLNKYNTETVECVMQDDKLIGTKYDKENSIIKEMWIRPVMQDGITPDFFAQEDFVLAGGYDLEEVPYNRIFPTFENFMKEWCGYTTINPATGKFERWTNPNKKWDWYEVGGRWNDALLLKDGNKDSVALCRDVDWGQMAQDQSDKLRQYYRVFHEAYALKPEYVDPEKVKDYNNWCSRYDEVAKVLHTPEEYIRAYNGTGAADKEVYGCDESYFGLDLDEVRALLTQDEETYSSPKANTFAYIDEHGDWKQRAEMGWWGYSDSSKGTDCYNAEWWQFVQNLDPQAQVCVVDCHI